MAQFVSAVAITLDDTDSGRVVGEWQCARVTLKKSNDVMIGWRRCIAWMRFNGETTSFERAMVSVMMEDDMAGVRDRWWGTDWGGGEI